MIRIFTLNLKIKVMPKRETIASSELLESIVYKLLDNNQITPETCDDLITCIKNTPSRNIYKLND